MNHSTRTGGKRQELKTLTCEKKKTSIQYLEVKNRRRGILPTDTHTLPDGR